MMRTLQPSEQTSTNTFILATSHVAVELAQPDSTQLSHCAEHVFSTRRRNSSEISGVLLMPADSTPLRHPQATNNCRCELVLVAWRSEGRKGR
eukprot:3424696-Rhodomonas_salina.2